MNSITLNQLKALYEELEELIGADLLPEESRDKIEELLPALWEVIN